MADAIIPVPIYDPQYQQLANLVLNAKAVYSITGVGSIKSVSVDSYRIALLYNISASAYKCWFPALICIPDTSLSITMSNDMHSHSTIASFSLKSSSIEMAVSAGDVELYCGIAIFD